MAKKQVKTQSNKAAAAGVSAVLEKGLNGAEHRSAPDDLDQRIQRYLVAKQAFNDFVFEAEDEVATALEVFTAEQLKRWAKPILSGLNRTDLAVDMFLSEGKVADQRVIDRFLHLNPDYLADLSEGTRSFNGLFVVRRQVEGGYEVMNWLTEKDYSVWIDSSQSPEVMGRLSPDEIVLARLWPVSESDWVFSGPLTLLGKLGKPKLAVAIGNFKQWFPQQLYGDAPELKEAAWISVKQQYDDFLTFFGSPPITLSGYELNKKLKVYQAQTTEKQLSEAGLDSNQSLREMAENAGLSDEEVMEAIATVGEESSVAQKVLQSNQSLKMVMPEVSLPDELRKAEAITVFSHPRWGQSFLKDYSRLIEKLEQAEQWDDSIDVPDAPLNADFELLDRWVLKHLEDAQVNAYVWEQLAKSYSSSLERSLRRILSQPAFSIKQDLPKVLAQYGKPLTPVLPESASVPIHLHNLFQEAMVSVSKSASQKGAGQKQSKKKKSGFGR